MITDATIASGHTFVPVPPSQGNLQAFLTAAEIVVGSDFVCNSEETIASYAQSCSATSRRSLAVIQPSCTEEVQQIVLLAGKYSIKLYPSAEVATGDSVTLAQPPTIKSSSIFVG